MEAINNDSVQSLVNGMNKIFSITANSSKSANEDVILGGTWISGIDYRTDNSEAIVQDFTRHHLFVGSISDGYVSDLADEMYQHTGIANKMVSPDTKGYSIMRSIKNTGSLLERTSTNTTSKVISDKIRVEIYSTPIFYFIDNEGSRILTGDDYKVIAYSFVGYVYIEKDREE